MRLYALRFYILTLAQGQLERSASFRNSEWLQNEGQTPIRSLVSSFNSVSRVKPFWELYGVVSNAVGAVITSIDRSEDFRPAIEAGSALLRLLSESNVSGEIQNDTFIVFKFLSDILSDVLSSESGNLSTSTRLEEVSSTLSLSGGETYLARTLPEMLQSSIASRGSSEGKSSSFTDSYRADIS